MLAEQVELELAGPRQPGALARLDRDVDNLRAALGWSLEHHETEIALRLTDALALFWYNRSHWNESRSWFEAALALSDGASRSSRVKELLGAQ
jgi:predicted ATPase